MKLTQYSPADFESKIYKIWEERGYFEIDGNKKIAEDGKNFCIMLPPPNVTGSLHIGHALNHTLSDIVVRYKRMDGYKTLWQPGTDHAGIATQNVVEKRLLAEGVTKESIGRDRFLQKVWEWKAESGGSIVKQMRKLGASPAWSRERFTMDAGLANAVKKSFIKLYEEGYIVRGDYLVNWCTHDGALSDIEVEYKETNGALYHIKYPLKDGGNLVVATTRPETYFGDTAVMVHPDDERYKALIGKSVILPIINREIKIIADEHVDMEFGTGVVKVTPAHDTNDYEVGKRHNLEKITIFDTKGILNEQCGEFAGLERLGARKTVVAKLEELGFIEKIEAREHQVGHCYRCGNVVEPYISKQWFLKKELASAAIAKADAGETKFIPKQWKNNYDSWMRELRDWCISRQLWWGHRIPVMYCDECDFEWAGEDGDYTECPKCGSSDIWQDKDVLDTWFSSALWPFTTLGWGNEDNAQINSDDIKNFYPNSLLITGFDILFFWVARMMMMGEHFMGKLPFNDVFLHALVRDENGQKMSKSKGNVIDPLEVIEKYSADALRFALAMLCVPGRDVRLSEEKFTQARNFANKLFNAAKYLQMNIDSFEDLDESKISSDLGKYMLAQMQVATNELRLALDEYRFSDGATGIYKYFWDIFCDQGIELSKASKDSVAELGTIFKESLKLLHPFMPFLSEELYQSLSNTSLEDGAESIMIKSMPKSKAPNEQILKDFGLIWEAIVSIRRAKANAGVANKKTDKAFVMLNSANSNEQFCKFVAPLSRCDEIEFVSTKPQKCLADISDSMQTFVPLNAEDISAMVAKLEKQLEKLAKEEQKLGGMVNNEKFRASAPAALLAQNEAAYKDVQEKIAKIEAEIKALS